MYIYMYVYVATFTSSVSIYEKCIHYTHERRQKIISYDFWSEWVALNLVHFPTVLDFYNMASFISGGFESVKLPPK